MSIGDKIFDYQIKRMEKKYEKNCRKIEKEYQRDMRGIVAYCRTKNEFNKAVDEKRKTIVALDVLYDELYDNAKKSQDAKLKKHVGTMAIAAGMFFLPGISAWLALGGGMIAVQKGKNEDDVIQYKVSIDEINKTISFTR